MKTDTTPALRVHATPTGNAASTHGVGTLGSGICTPEMDAATAVHRATAVDAVTAVHAEAAAVTAVAAGRTLVSAMTALTGLVAGAAGWSGADRGTLLADLDRVIDGLSVVRGTVLVADRDAGAWRATGVRSYDAARERSSGVGQRGAAAQTRQADHLAADPAAAAAVTDGRIPLAHAAVLAKVAATGTPAQRAALADPATHQALLETAERQDADTFTTTVARWAATVDPDGLEREHEALRAQRYLHVTHSSAGTCLKGRLDPIAGRRVALALEALSLRPAADDDRDPGERRADALDDMAKQILADPDTKPGGHVPPQITMILTPETWAAARAERDRRRQAATDSQSAPSESTAVVSYSPATLEGGTLVPVSEVAAAMCDCDITRVVIDADGAPLDLGRTRRLFTGPQRKAVLARDRECGWPDCHAPARWCEIHHLAWWDRDNGVTSVNNGIAMCPFHHHETHRRDLVITRIPGSGAGFAKKKAPPGGRPRGPGAAPPGPLALVTYEFRDRTGRLIAATSDAARPSADTAPPDGPAPPAGDSPPTSTALDDPATPDGPTAPNRLAPPDGATARNGPATPDGDALPPTAPPDDLNFEWTTDPFTGARVPTFFLDTGPS